MRPDGTPPEAYSQAYSTTARRLHWWTVAFLAVIIPIGLVMDGDIVKWSEPVQNRLYDIHKLLGFSVLWLVLARLAYRLSHGAPADEPTLEPWQKIVSHVTHWGIYTLLIVVPLLGWSGAQMYPAVELFGRFSLPSFLPVDTSMSGWVFIAHKLLAFTLIALIGMHVGAALFHYLIRRDGVLNRMWTSLPRRDGR